MGAGTALESPSRQGREEKKYGDEVTSLSVERLNDLHGDLLSVGNAARRGRAFLKAEERRHKKAFDLPQGGDEGRTAHNRRRRDSTPILSVARQSPGPHSPGLDERKKAGLLTSGSSYSLRLTARLRAVASWSFRRPLQRRYRTGFTPVSLFSPDFYPGHFLAGWPCVLRAWLYQRTGSVNRRSRRRRQAALTSQM